MDSNNEFRADVGPNQASLNEHDDENPSEIFTPLSIAVLISFVLIFLTCLIFAISFVRTTYREESGAECSWCMSCGIFAGSPCSRSTITENPSLRKNRDSTEEAKKSDLESGIVNCSKDNATDQQSCPPDAEPPTRTFSVDDESTGSSISFPSSSSCSLEYTPDVSSEVASSVAGKDMQSAQSVSMTTCTTTCSTSPNITKHSPYFTHDKASGRRYAGAFAIPEEKSEGQHVQDDSEDVGDYSVGRQGSSKIMPIASADQCISDTTPSGGGKTRMRIVFSKVWKLTHLEK